MGSTMANDDLLYKKLDEAIAKLSDVSGEIKQVLVVHETKLDAQETMNDQVYDQIDKLHSRVGDLRDEMSTKFETMERWRWIVCGVCIALGALMGNAKLLELLGG